MADTEAESTWTPTIAVDDAGPAHKRITITVPKQAVDECIETSYGALQTQAALPGFRKGRAPRALLERRFGSTLLQEARTQLLADAWSKTVDAKKLKPVTQPEIDAATKDRPLERGKDFTFTVDVEVVPEFELPKLEGIPIRRPVAEVAESLVDLELRRNTYRFGTPKRVDGPFKPLDRLLGAVTVKLNGKDEVFFESADAIVVVPDAEDKGRGQLLGLMFDDLGARLEGRSVGETLVFETTGPASHEREEIRGAAVKIEYRIREAERVDPVDANELASQLGLETVENLRGQIRLGLERRRDQEQRSAMREQVYDYLADAVDFALPEKLSQAQVQRQLDVMRMDLLQRGIEPDKVENRLAEARASSEGDTRRRLKLFFVLARLAEHFKVDVTDAEINGRISAIAAQQNLRPDQVRAELERANRIGDIALSIREAKAADRVIDRATITDLDAASWNKEAEAKREAARSRASSSRSSAKAAPKTAAAPKEAKESKESGSGKPSGKGSRTSR